MVKSDIRNSAYIDKEYDIKSNRESGFGRYDVIIIPKDKSKKGIINVIFSKIY